MEPRSKSPKKNGRLIQFSEPTRKNHQGEGSTKTCLRPFAGFDLPSSNTTYTPNQFFDVVLRYAQNTGVIRATAYVLRKQLGWCDADGNPQEAQVSVSYTDLMTEAGIQRKLIRSALDESVARGYLRCVQPGRPDSPGLRGVPSLYELNWDDRLEYITDPVPFSGFYSHQGNRTYIPNQFFDVVIPNENLSVIKVVGAIIRHTIGFQNRYGFRREQVHMSVTHLERITGLGRQAVREGLKHALDAKYIIRIKEGNFDKNAGLTSIACTYGIRWSDSVPDDQTSPDIKNSELEEPSPQETSGKITTGNQWKNHHGRLVEKGPRDQWKNHHGTSGKITTGNQWKNHHGIEIKQENKTLNKTFKNKTAASMQPERKPAAAAVSLDILDKFNLLKNVGFDEQAAHEIASVPTANLEAIRNQIEWLPLRKPTTNPLGMLRLAILGNWSKPGTGKLGTSQVSAKDQFRSLTKEFLQHYYAGYYGNNTLPASEPSETEISKATGFIQGLLKIWNDESKIPEWGREFGELVRIKNRYNEEHRPYFTTDRNRYGDEFYRTQEIRKEDARRKAREKFWEEHREQHERLYMQYLQETEKRFQMEKPEAYSGFEQTRAKQRERLAGPRAFHKVSREILDQFDSEAARLKAFQEYFADDGEEPVFDFFDWDERLNPGRFNEEAVEP